MARFDGARQRVGVWLRGLLIAVRVAGHWGRLGVLPHRRSGLGRVP
jgi:hypothetical protein